MAFSVSGILASHPYDLGELQLSLRVLDPRPQAIIMGERYTEDDAKQARTVKQEYPSETNGQDGTLLKTHLS